MQITRPLTGTLTPELFDEAPFTQGYKKRDMFVKIDAREERVLFNNAGDCCAQTFGTLLDAKIRYEIIVRGMGCGEY